MGQTDIDEIVRGERAIYVFGRVDYKDIFKNDWWTEFRHVLGGEGGVRPDGSFAVCPDGNGAT
jgi:hypothetical protein